jgi:hypothetical protein
MTSPGSSCALPAARTAEDTSVASPWSTCVSSVATFAEGLQEHINDLFVPLWLPKPPGALL